MTSPSGTRIRGAIDMDKCRRDLITETVKAFREVRELHVNPEANRSFSPAYQRSWSLMALLEDGERNEVFTTLNGSSSP